MGKAKSAIESQKEMLKRAKEFVDEISKIIHVEEVYVVGSRARGDYLDTSDIDLVIISEDFKDLPYLGRREFLSKYAKPRVENFTFTKEEWENPSSIYVREMKKEAKRLDEMLNAFF